MSSQVEEARMPSLSSFFPTVRPAVMWVSSYQGRGGLGPPTWGIPVHHETGDALVPNTRVHIRHHKEYPRLQVRHVTIRISREQRSGHGASAAFEIQHLVLNASMHVRGGSEGSHRTLLSDDFHFSSARTRSRSSVESFLTHVLPAPPFMAARVLEIHWPRRTPVNSSGNRTYFKRVELLPLSAVFTYVSFSFTMNRWFTEVSSG